MKCQTCGTVANTRKDRRAHDMATGHDRYEPTAEAMARYEARVAAASEPQTYYISPLTAWINRSR